MIGDRPPAPRPVVVAVDGIHLADAAVEWAAAEAAARRSALLVVHALRPPTAMDLAGLLSPADALAVDEAVGRQVLQEAVRRAAAVAPDLDLSARLLVAAPTRVLLQLSRDAALLVLGSRGHGSVRGRFAGSVAGHVATHAGCPAVVVRSRPRRELASTGPRVVVGVEDTRSCFPALDFAFEAAAQRGIPLVAVRARRGDAGRFLDAMCGPLPTEQGSAPDDLDRLLHPWRELFAGVPVTHRLVRADPVTALLSESVGAALLVVGCRRRATLRERLFGSVSRRLLARASSPVAVVGTDGMDAEPRHRRTRIRRPAVEGPAAGEWPPQRKTPRE